MTALMRTNSIVYNELDIDSGIITNERNSTALSIDTLKQSLIMPTIGYPMINMVVTILIYFGSTSNLISVILMKKRR